ncbi:hypothetical protein B0H14DRAFT_2628856 [Mycena olivaceomarginata]|nr:hypothetical protein B0H14DRAFT_2628856 [Mycena olivaceomarginata]
MYASSDVGGLATKSARQLLGLMVLMVFLVKKSSSALLHEYTALLSVSTHDTVLVLGSVSANPIHCARVILPLKLVRLQQIECRPSSSVESIGTTPIKSPFHLGKVAHCSVLSVRGAHKDPGKPPEGWKIQISPEKYHSQ